jgi:hypothetical protein
MKLGIKNTSRNLEYFRLVNDQNTSKSLKTYTPVPTVFSSPIPDNRDKILRNIKNEIDYNLIIKIPDRDQMLKDMKKINENRYEN